MTKARKAAILRAVNRAKKSQFKVTAIKVELEAQLNRNRSAWNTTNECHTYMMTELEKLGLVEYIEGDWIALSHGGETQWHPVLPLTYAEFYVDGSVDSEFTFTLMLDKAENIFLLPKVIKVFKDLAKEVGQGMDVRGSGMHTAFLNDRQGAYPTSASDANYNRFLNYRRSMRMLLPALYFLGATNEETRGLSFRRPEIGSETHRAAVDYRGGALEFRIFDTCYDKPEQILDNVVVMANTMKYWTSRFVSSGAEKISSRVRFGVDSNNRLDRFYVTYTHLDLLNFGLIKLKPAYYTISQIKAQRKFKTDKRSLGKARKEREKAAEAEYEEYADRFEFSLMANKGRLMANLAEDMNNRIRNGLGERRDPEAVKAEIEAEVEAVVAVEKNRKKSLKRYVTDTLRQLDAACGEWTLAVEEG